MLIKRTPDFGQPLNSIDGFKYLSIIWFIIGTNPPNARVQLYKRILYHVYSVLINFCCAFAFPASMLINLFFITSYNDLVANISLNVSISMSAIKQLAVIRHRHNLFKSHEFLKVLDERSNQNKKDRKNILTAVFHSQLYCLLFPIYAFCGFGFAYNGWHHNQLIYNAWYPDLFSNPKHNYLAVFIFQFLSQIFTGLQAVFNDTYPLCYLTLMIGHLESLAARIARIGWDERPNMRERSSAEELKNCVKDHKNLLSYFECIRPLISITLLFQFFIDGIALCLTAITLTFFSRDLNEQIFALLYLIILLIQMFPCCWQVNLLMEKSDRLTTAMYSCNWMDQDLKFRKMLIIFMQRSQKTTTILAGNLAPVTLQTFLNVIRFSFSMFTILSKK